LEKSKAPEGGRVGKIRELKRGRASFGRVGGKKNLKYLD